MDLEEQLFSRRIIPVVVLDDPGDADPLAEALVAGGLPVAEITFRTAAAPAAIAAMAARGDVLVGAGTVGTVSQVDQAFQAGARFVVSPGTSLPVIERCQELGLAVLPGAVTASEAMTLMGLGLDTVKFFPAQTFGGAAAIRALGGPFPGLRFVPTGGIEMGNLMEYLAVPSVRAVGGSWMVPPGPVAARDQQTIADLCAKAVAAASPAL